MRRRVGTSGLSGRRLCRVSCLPGCVPACPHACFSMLLVPGGMLLVPGGTLPLLPLALLSGDLQLTCATQTTHSSALRFPPHPAALSSTPCCASLHALLRFLPHPAALSSTPCCAFLHPPAELVEARHSTQLLRVPLVTPGSGRGAVVELRNRRRRITGLAATPGGELLVATKQGALLRYLTTAAWRPEDHRLWPRAFRAAVRQLLLCAGRRPTEEEQRRGRGGAGLWALPHAVLLHVAAMLAGRRADWLPEVPPPPQVVQPRRR